MTMTKAAADPLAVMKTIDSVVLRYAFIIDKLKPNSKSNIKERKISSNKLDKALHDSHLLKTLRNPSKKKDKQTKCNKKVKHVHFSPIVFVKLVIP